MSSKKYPEQHPPRLSSPLRSGLVLPLMALTLLVTVPAMSQQDNADDTAPAESQLEVTEMATGLDYDPVTKAVVDTSSVFTATTEKVICFTRIEGAQTPTQITHAWYHEGQIKAQVKLDVRSPSWRTYSSKRLLPAWTGQWEVKVLDSSGTVLATAAFTVQ